MKVLVPANVDFSSRGSGDAQFELYDPAQEIPAHHHDAEVLVVWGNPAGLLKRAATDLARLRWVQTLSAGPNDALAAGFSEGVVITSGRGLHDTTVAEHTIGLLLCAARRFHEMRDAQHRRAWPGHLGGKQPVRPKGVFTSLDGATVTIWGFGSIAAHLTPILKLLGANVMGIATEAGARHGVDVVGEDDVDGLLPATDALVMILPGAPGTRHALDARRLALLPKHAWVVNVGRGETIDTDALVGALRGGQIAGAALDVFELEPLPAESPLWDLQNVIVSPHAAGGRPVGAEYLIVENVERFLRGETLKNTVDRAKGY